MADRPSPFYVQTPARRYFQDMQQKPDLVILNTEALTMDASQPQAQAVAVAKERILAVGSDEEIKGLAGPDTEVIDVLLTRVPPTQREFSSCGGANSQSKHCGRCEKCAFVFAVLHTTTEGRRVAKRVFRSNLLEDVELYRPWLDLRHRPPLACIGERSEVWAAFERLARDGSELPVVRKWRTCALRQRETTAPKSSRVATSPRDSRQDRQLAKPVEQAHRLVRRWAREADR
mgnify:CR=1 FL=1